MSFMVLLKCPASSERLLCVLYFHMLLIYRLKLPRQDLIRPKGRSRRAELLSFAHCHNFYHINVKMCSWNGRPVTEALKLKREPVSVQAELAGEWNPSKSASGHLLDNGAGPALQNVLVLVFSRDYNSLITTQGCGSAPWGKKKPKTLERMMT